MAVVGPWTLGSTFTFWKGRINAVAGATIMKAVQLGGALMQSSVDQWVVDKKSGLSFYYNTAESKM